MGSNKFGQCGIAANRVQDKQGAQSIKFVNTPKLIDCLSKQVIKKVSCGLNHAVAVAEDSGLCYTWGNGSHG